MHIHLPLTMQTILKYFLSNTLLCVITSIQASVQSVLFIYDFGLILAGAKCMRKHVSLYTLYILLCKPYTEHWCSLTLFECIYKFGKQAKLKLNNIVVGFTEMRTLHRMILHIPFVWWADILCFVYIRYIRV